MSYKGLTAEELKYTDKLNKLEIKFINENKFYGCDPCWIKYLRPIFLTYYVFASDSPASTESCIFSRSYIYFNKCTHHSRRTFTKR